MEESKSNGRSDYEILYNAPKKVRIQNERGEWLTLELREPTDARLDEYINMFAEAYKDIIMIILKGKQSALTDADINLDKIQRIGAQFVSKAIGEEPDYARNNFSKRQNLEITNIMLELIGWETIQSLFNQARQNFQTAKPVGSEPPKPPFAEQPSQ